MSGNDNEDQNNTSYRTTTIVIIGLIIACCVIGLVFMLLRRRSSDGRGIGQARSARRVADYRMATSAKAYNTPPLPDYMQNLPNIQYSAPYLAPNLNGGLKKLKNWLDAFLR